jgi:hypothetical protein
MYHIVSHRWSPRLHGNLKTKGLKGKKVLAYHSDWSSGSSASVVEALVDEIISIEECVPGVSTQTPYPRLVDKLAPYCVPDGKTLLRSQKPVRLKLMMNIGDWGKSEIRNSD